MISSISLNWVCIYGINIGYEIFRFPNHLSSSADMQYQSATGGLNLGLVPAQCHYPLMHETTTHKERRVKQPVLSFLFLFKITFCETKTEIVWNWRAGLFCLDEILHFNNKKLIKSVTYLLGNNWHEDLIVGLGFWGFFNTM